MMCMFSSDSPGCIVFTTKPQVPGAENRQGSYFIHATSDHVMVFPVVTYGCESWTIKKAEC